MTYQISKFEEPKEKPQNKSKYPHAETIMKLFPNFQFSWRVYKQFCVAAENLWASRGEADCKSALEFYYKHRDEPFIPSIHNPIDLDMKWDKLVAYSLKK